MPCKKKFSRDSELGQPLLWTKNNGAVAGERREAERKSGSTKAPIGTWDFGRRETVQVVLESENGRNGGRGRGADRKKTSGSVSCSIHDQDGETAEKSTRKASLRP